MKKSSKKTQLLVILGPTASGKSALAVQLAKRFNGEVISADSRQIYKGLDLGTGKITKKEMSGVPHHMLDIASPQRIYTADDYKKDAEKIIQNISDKGTLPIICGGTGFYIDCLLYGIQLPDVGPNKILRDKLEKLPSEKIYTMLLTKDKARALKIGMHNKIRLIRALEILAALGKIPRLPKKTKKYDSLIIGIQIDQKILQKKIKIRLAQRIKAGMIKEVKNLHAKGLSWKRMDMLGLEYRYVSKHLQGHISKEELTSLLEIKISKYAKKQMTWFKRNQDIRWHRTKELSSINKEISRFLSL